MKRIVQQCVEIPTGGTLWTPRLHWDHDRRRRFEEARMDVGGWLRSLGLGRYEILFRQNDIGDEVLSELTDGDLEKFGVTCGHRKRLLKAIAGLTRMKPEARGETWWTRDRDWSHQRSGGTVRRAAEATHAA
jgi:hypothetical protein